MDKQEGGREKEREDRRRKEGGGRREEEGGGRRERLKLKLDRKNHRATFTLPYL
jgi:hypothetical protein